MRRIVPAACVAAAFAVPLLATATTLAQTGAAPKTDVNARHIVYLHGFIVQRMQSARPVHPQFGTYELDAILDAFRQRGFVVHSEIRPLDATVPSSAEHTATQVRELLAAGVPADHVTVVGASMGAAIALATAARLGNPALRYALLGTCLSQSSQVIEQQQGRPVVGRVLSIRESSDDLTNPCTPWKQDAAHGENLVAREMVVDTGLHHGFLFRPLPVWLDPVTAFAEGKEERP